VAAPNHAARVERAGHSGGVLNPAADSAVCPACGDAGYRVLFRASDRLYQTTDREFRIVECKGCRLLRLDPRPGVKELPDYYPRNYWFAPAEDAASRMEERWRRFALRDHVNFVERALRDSGERGLVLDVGCGGGLFLDLIRESTGLPVLGLDYSLDAARVAWSTNSVPAFCGSLCEVPLTEESCAAVTMFHILEHLHDPEPYIHCARRLLRPDGRLIVQVPNAGCWQFLLLGEKWNGVDVPRHLVHFRQDDLANLLEHCGFELLRVKHFSLRDNPAGLATSLAPSLDPMARRVRQTPESPRMRMFRDIVYFALMCAVMPLTMLEAACRAGSTIMVEARIRQ